MHGDRSRGLLRAMDTRARAPAPFLRPNCPRPSRAPAALAAHVDEPPPRRAGCLEDDIRRGEAARPIALRTRAVPLVK